MPQVSRSAYSSPSTQRRVPAPPPRSRDTLDLGKPTTPAVTPQLLQDRNRNTFNRNQTWSPLTQRAAPPLRGADNSNVLPQAARSEEQPPENQAARSVALSNGNLRPPSSSSSTAAAAAHSSYHHIFRGRCDSASQSDEDMGTPEDSSAASSPGPLPLPTIEFNLVATMEAPVDRQERSLEDEEEEAAATETHTPRVNMATVAPFSYR